MKSRFLRFKNAIDEYFSGDADLFAEVMFTRNVNVYARHTSTRVLVSQAGDSSFKGREARASLKAMHAVGWHPIPKPAGRELIANGECDVYFFYLRDHSGCTESECAVPSYGASPPPQPYDQFAWGPDSEKPVMHLEFSSGWVGRASIERAIREHFGSDSTSESISPGWPWGEYETRLLKQLSAAAERFWKNYDPSEPDTAETKSVIVAWLKERGVSERTAEQIDTILRAEDLPKGPRQKRVAAQ